MRNAIKRLAGIIMVMIMVMAVTAACGSKEEEPKEAAQDQEAEEQTEITEDETEDTEPAEDSGETEGSQDADDLEYITCTVDELVTEMYADVDAAAEKYNGKYLELTGLLETAEIDNNANPPGQSVRMKNTVTPPDPNTMAMVVAYSDGNEWMSQEEFEEVAGTLAEGDEVVLRGGVMTIYEDGNPLCFLSLIDIRKK